MTLILALVGFVVTLTSAAVTWNMLASAMAVIGGRLAQVYTKQTAERASMMQVGDSKCNLVAIHYERA